MPIKTNQPLTRLLSRQLKKTIGVDANLSEDMLRFINMINDAYLFNQSEEELYRRAEDISARDYAKLTASLKEKNSFLDTFNHGLAHDIKNHSSNIIGLVNMLKKYAQRENWKMINKIIKNLDLSANQLTTIVQGFLHISRAEANLKEDHKPINSSQLIQSVENEIAFLKNTKKVEINYNIENVIFVEVILRIILVNLISNSIKYSKPNKPAIINVNVNCDDNNVWVEVKDNGIGMDVSENNKKLFNLFNDTFETKGYGVGLFLVKKISDKNKGIIKVDSQLGVGTSLKIVFPKKIII